MSTSNVNHVIDRMEIGNAFDSMSNTLKALRANSQEKIKQTNKQRNKVEMILNRNVVGRASQMSKEYTIAT